MHVSKEFLIEAVSLSILVALILISMQMFQRTIKISSLLGQKQEKMITELEEYEIIKYEDCLVNGISAINYIKQMCDTYHIPMVLINEKGEFDIKGYSDYAELKNSESEKYIRPLAKYRCKVIRDENDTITEIRIGIEMGEVN